MCRPIHRPIKARLCQIKPAHHDLRGLSIQDRKRMQKTTFIIFCCCFRVKVAPALKGGAKGSIIISLLTSSCALLQKPVSAIKLMRMVERLLKKSAGLNAMQGCRYPSTNDVENDVSNSCQIER